MRSHKRLCFCFLTIAAALLLCVLALPTTAHAADVSYLTFTLNETGDGYIVSNCNDEASGDLVIPATYNELPVTGVGKSAFSNCCSLTSITIPDSVTSIGDSAFAGCTSLNYNIYNNANYLGNETNPYVVLVGVTNKTLHSYEIHPDTEVIYTAAFKDCASLTSITIPDTVTGIGASAFAKCTSLTSITIPDSVTGIGYSAFSNCTSLTSITIPDSVTSIGDSAFYYCSDLASVTIGNSVTSIGKYAFENCTTLTSITIPDSVTSIGKAAFDGCLGMTSMTIGNGVVSIGESAFYNCIRLTSLAIPDSVTSIGEHAFHGCYRLERIAVGNGVTSIGLQVFSGCSALTTVTLQDSVTCIEAEAFYGCSKLATVIYCGTNGKWAAIDKSTGNDALDKATLQLHDYESGVCALCGHLESGATAIKLAAPAGPVYRGDTVTVTVSTSQVEHCATGGFLFDFDTDVFEYVSGEALVSGFTAAGVSTVNDVIAGYFMDGDETLEGAIFQITLRVKEDADFADYTISGSPSLSARVDGVLEGINCVAFDTTVSIACRHSFGDWIDIDETWHKHTCTICSFEETLYIEYSVVFQHTDGTVISSATYHYGDTVEVPQPTAPNSHFVGWDKEVERCTGNAVYTAIFQEYTPGDMDGDGEKTCSDAVYLLLHVMFGEEVYPLGNAPADIDGNGKVDQEDAIYLLLHAMFGETSYPLTVPGNKEN